MAITYGMSAKEFWEDNPDLFWAYRFSYYESLKLQQKVFNHNAWLQGAYFYDALLIALNNSFTKKRLDYPSEPYNLKGNTEQPEDEKKRQIEIQVADIRARIKQVNKIKSSTTDKGKTEGGGKNERANIRVAD